MAFNFPDGAINGQKYTADNGLVYVYNGQVWLVDGVGTISSLDTRYAQSGSYLTSLNGAVSSSTQVLGGSGVYSSSAQLPSGLVSGSSQLSSSYDSRYVLSGSITQTTWDNIASKPSGIVSGSSQILGGSGIYSSSAQLPTGLISGSSQLPSGLISGSSQLPVGLISGSSQVLGGSGIYSSSAQLPSGLISGSSQLPSGIVSGSSQLTASYDTRYTLSGSVVSGTTPAGTISGSSQLTSSFDGRYLVTGSVTSSINALNTFSASENIKATTLGTYTGSIDTKFTTLGTYTGSLATTGSNSFNGNQTITGSLNIIAGNVIASSITANTSSLYLTSGSNLYVQNNGTAEITGSLKVSGSITIQSGSITMPNRPGFRVYGLGGATTAVTVLSGSMTIVDYNQGGWDNTTGTFTAPIAGLYQVNLVCRTNSNSSAQSVQAIVYKNYTGLGTGTAQIMVEWAANTTANHIGGSTISRLAVGDTLRAVVSVGTASFDANDNFSVAYIG